VENLNPFVYLLFYSAIVILLVVMFIRNGRRQAPSQLRFGPRRLEPGGSTSAPDLNLIESPQIHGGVNVRSRARALNVFFNYNGETFDAYEILGIPAGCGLPEARAHYERTFAAKTQCERFVYDAAILALEKSKKSAASA
jgi:hypothetical protein